MFWTNEGFSIHKAQNKAKIPLSRALWQERLIDAG